MVDSRITRRRPPLYNMFTAVPPRYDLVNRVITLGMDKAWRLAAAKECLVSRPQKMLDLCCGTGDLAIILAQLGGEQMEVTGLDYSQPMLDIATKKARGLERKPLFVKGDAAALPFPDEHFDCIGISFAFRNLTYKNPLAHRHIAEMFRVLKVGGRLIIVETSQPGSRLMRKLFHLYLGCFVATMGSLVSGNRGAYSYLAKSAAQFYSSHELEEILLKAGFRQVVFRPLFFGVVGIHAATR